MHGRFEQCVCGEAELRCKEGLGSVCVCGGGAGLKCKEGLNSNLGLAYVFRLGGTHCSYGEEGLGSV